MAKMILSIRRAGSVRASKMIPNTHKCAAMRTKVYKYEVVVVGTNRRLSPEGYLLNNERVQEFFEVRFGAKAPQPWDAVSCEMMAQISAEEICSMLVAEGIDVITVTVTITGSNGAKITATCPAPQKQQATQDESDALRAGYPGYSSPEWEEVQS